MIDQLLSYWADQKLKDKVERLEDESKRYRMSYTAAQKSLEEVADAYADVREALRSPTFNPFKTRDPKLQVDALVAEIGRLRAAEAAK